MKTVTTWLPPVSASLLLHLVVILAVMQNDSQNTYTPVADQSLTVEMWASAPPNTLKPKTQKTEQIPLELPEPVLIKPAETIPALTIPKEEPASTAATAQANIETQPNEGNNVTASQKIVVQPLRKLTRAPAFLHRIEPVYPGPEQRAGTQATVLAEITLDKQGKIIDIKIVKSAGIYFDNAVIEAIRQSTFTPGLIEKEAVAVRVLVPFRFKLK